jgi:hypothetical protein
MAKPSGDYIPLGGFVCSGMKVVMMVWLVAIVLLVPVTLYFLASAAHVRHLDRMKQTRRLSTMPGASLPGHVERKDRVLMPAGKSPLRSDVDRVHFG